MTEAAAMPALPADYAETLTALPANSWTFRRLVVIAALVILLLFHWRMIELMPVADLVEVAKWDVGLMALIFILYLVGPTAEHIVRLGNILQAISPFARKA